MANDYFVRIHEPTTMRITLLESSKSVVQSLQRYQRIMLLRKHKLEQVAILKSQIKEILLLMEKVEQFLPKEHLPDESYERNKAKKSFRIKKYMLQPIKMLGCLKKSSQNKKWMPLIKP